MCTFHPAYGYEDFLEGYRPVTTSEQQLIFEQQEGIFKTLCEDARGRPEHNFYLVIDEINRGDIPRIFGELLTILEKDKRGQAILLPLSGKAFSVPENVYIIGTMNTADRSIALLDTALRRRFGFIELMPDYSVLGDAVVANTIPLGTWLEELNTRILSHIGRDTRNLQIGHAYLLEKGRPVTDTDRFVRILQDDIIPLLEEYCYEDYDALKNILGAAFVDREKQRVRHEMFVVDRRDELMAALAEQWPELITSADVVAAEAIAEELEEEDEEAEEPTG
jgi:5-methylcytosine-specific restriction protein B